MGNLAKRATETFCSLLLLFVMHGSSAKEVVYHVIMPPYNPDYIGTTPDPNDLNNYFYLRSNQPPAEYGYDINQQYNIIMQNEYFYRDYGDWVSGDYETRDTVTTGW